MRKIILDADHRYFVDGEPVPGFTEIKNLYRKPSDFYTEGGRAEGTALHHWLLFLAQGKDPTEEPDQRITWRVAAIRKFLLESKFKFVDGEKPLYCPSGPFCCTPDLWGYIGGRRCLIEAKRGGVEPWHKLQTAAQKLALRANGFIVQDRYALYLSYGSFRLKLHDDVSDESRWLAMVAGFHANAFYGGIKK